MKLNATRTRISQDALVDAFLASSRMFLAVATKSLSDTGEEVTLAQYRTLVVLASRGPQNLATLAAIVGVTPATATRMCDRLTRKHLVTRRQEKRDRRTRRIELSAKGRAIVNDVTSRRRKEIERIVSAIAPADRDQFIRLLDQLSRAGGEVLERDWPTSWEL